MKVGTSKSSRIAKVAVGVVCVMYVIDSCSGIFVDSSAVFAVSVVFAWALSRIVAFNGASSLIFCCTVIIFLLYGDRRNSFLLMKKIWLQYIYCYTDLSIDSSITEPRIMFASS
jgi:hypothetical protein